MALLVVLLPTGASHSSGSAAPAAADVVVDASSPSPFVTGMAASIAIGQPNVSTDTWDGTPNASNIVPDPEEPCMNAQGDLFIPNFSGSRVTEYLAPLTTNESASVVIGQRSFYTAAAGTNQSSLDSPASCTFDSHGNLWVPDYFNDRVLEFKPPFTTGMNASLVLGQDNYNTSTAGTNQSAFDGPAAIAFDSSGDLWLAETYNNRLLEFKPPFTDGMNASLVLGQSNFNTSEAGTSSTNLSFPDALAYAHGVLWVSEYDNNRVIGFSAPFSDGEGATYVLGQSNFSVSNTVGPIAQVGPLGVSVDSHGNLWVAVQSQNRVLEYRPPFSSNETPSLVIGQSSFATTDAGVGAANLSQPLGAWVGPTGTLWVADGQNDRVLGYIPATYSVGITESGLPSGTAWSVTFAGVTEGGSAGGISLSEENGSYGWSATPVPGYVVSPASGVLNVSGSNESIPLTFTQVTYSVEFESSGLPASTAWTVTVAGVAHSSSTDGPITITEPNGTYAYTVTAVAGYNDTPENGSITVVGQSQEVGIGFFATPAPTTTPTTPTSPGNSSSGISLTLAILLAVVALIVGAVIGLVIGRRREEKSPPAPPPSAPQTLPPPATPGSTAGPVAPWSESGPESDGPPPGAR